jgi:iron complex outermembrane receptor protein
VTVSSRRLGNGIELAASVFNLFDNKYSDPGSEEHRQDSIVQIGRTVRVKLTYKFPHVR